MTSMIPTTILQLLKQSNSSVWKSSRSAIPSRPFSATAIRPISFPLLSHARGKTITPVSTTSFLPLSRTADTKRRSQQLLRDAFAKSFTTSRSTSIRQTYFPRCSGGYSGGSGGGRGSTWWSRLRRRIDNTPEMTIIYGLIGLNVGVYFLWQYAIESLRRFQDPSLYVFLSKNFILSEANIMSGRIWTLVTACFSQSTGAHIFVNCLGLFFVAPGAASLLGSSSFLGLYLAGGLVSSLTSLVWRRVSRDRRTGSEGASGAIYATLSFFAAMRPNTTFLLFFVVPMPAWALVAGLFAWDLFGSIARPTSGTDSPGHMGGILAGLGAAYMIRRRGPGAVWRGGPRWR